MAKPKKPTFKPFKPYVPVPPPGTYDPALNAQLDAARRGYGDVQRDTSLTSLRNAADLGIGREALTRTYDRGTQDLGTARARGVEDYGWQVGALQRSYQQLQRRQDEGARHSGVLSGGLALKAAATRAENQAFDRHPMDVQQTRFLTDNTQAQDRLGQDYRTGIDTQDLAYQRGETDLGRTTYRAGREFNAFTGDVAAQKLYQAAQTDWTAPYPKGQGVTAAGVPYRDKKVGAYIYRYDAKGKLLSKRKA